MKLTILVFGSAFSESVETRVNDGLIVGNRDYYQGKSVDEYLGIPFAQPPVDNLRFKSPQKPTPWTVLETQKKMPLCAQPDVKTTRLERPLIIILELGVATERRLSVSRCVHV